VRPRHREEVALEFIFGLIVLALDIWAIVNIVGSTASTGAKILWALLIPSPARARAPARHRRLRAPTAWSPSLVATLMW
jgi:hypothetical protein